MPRRRLYCQLFECPMLTRKTKKAHTDSVALPHIIQGEQLVFELLKRENLMCYAFLRAYVLLHYRLSCRIGRSGCSKAAARSLAGQTGERERQACCVWHERCRFACGFVKNQACMFAWYMHACEHVKTNFARVFVATLLEGLNKVLHNSGGLCYNSLYRPTIGYFSILALL